MDRYNVQVVDNALQAIGPRLKFLRVVGCDTVAADDDDEDEPHLLRMVSRHCRLLQILVCCHEQVEETLAEYVHLVDNLKHLASFSLYCSPLTAASEARQLLQAGAQLRELTLDRLEMSAMEFVELLQDFPQLELLSWNFADCSFNKQTQHLQLPQTLFAVTWSLWEQIFSVCPGIASLDIPASMLGSSAAAIGAAFGPTMRKLTLSALLPEDAPGIQALLLCCPNLIQFVLTGDGDAPFVDILKHLASSCSNLQHLRFTSRCGRRAEGDLVDERQVIRDEDMDDLLSKCPHLRSVSITTPTRLSKRTLEAMLHRRMVLRSLALSMSSSGAISKEEMAWFLEQAKDLQFLPPPSVLQIMP